MDINLFLYIKTIDSSGSRQCTRFLQDNNLTWNIFTSTINMINMIAITNKNIINI